MQRRPDWDAYFMDLATAVAARSTCPRAPTGGIGCVLVDERQGVVGTGYVGSLRGLDHCDAAGCLIDPDTRGCVRTVHAEQNALLHAHGLIGGRAPVTAYVTLSPCLACFKLLAQAGVRRIVYGAEYRRGVAFQRDLADAIGLALERLGAA